MQVRLNAFCLAVVCWVAVSMAAQAGRNQLPSDFELHPTAYGGAGGGDGRQDVPSLSHYPVVMVCSDGRTRSDWTTAPDQDTRGGASMAVYDMFLSHGFRPVELWMLDFAGPDEQMHSIEESTDDLKFFIAAVMRYTGTDRVQLVAHGTGCLLARLTIQKYNIAHWIESEVYIAGPFHGVSQPVDPALSFAGKPNVWSLAPGSSLLNEIVMFGEQPPFVDPATGETFTLDTLTIRSRTGGRDGWFGSNPDSPALRGARNVMITGLDWDSLRTSPRAAEVYIPFLDRETRPCAPEEDQDQDGARSVEFGGPDYDDTSAAVHPGAEEIPGDGIDQDCNGLDLSPLRGRDGEVPLVPPARPLLPPLPPGQE